MSSETTLTQSGSLHADFRVGVRAEPREAEITTRQFLAPLLIGIPALAVMFIVAALEGLPVRDPDAKYVGSPLALIGVIVSMFVLLDVIPRAIGLARSSDLGFSGSARQIFSQRWWTRRGIIVIVCILGFYATYLSYRNLKSFLPFVTDGALHDKALLGIDKAVFFGSHPSTLLHDMLGTGVSATILSAVYIAFLTFVPLSLGVALVWSNRVAAGLWYVTALGINWMLGALTYFVLPTLGPIYARPQLFSDLPTTGVSKLQHSLLVSRHEVLANPHASDAVQSIAGFASLHISVVLTAALIAQFVVAPKLLRVGLWVYFGLTFLATIYFGWHYVSDDLAGLAIAAIAVFGAAFMTGYRPPPFGSIAQTKARSDGATAQT